MRTPEFQILFRRLLGRLSSLSRFHCGAPLEVDFRELIDSAASIRLIHDDTRWTRWQRYSSRQDRRMQWEESWAALRIRGTLPFFGSSFSSDNLFTSATARHSAWANIESLNQMSENAAMNEVRYRKFFRELTSHSLIDYQIESHDCSSRGVT